MLLRAHRRGAPMLVVNGEKDTQVPIEDLYLLLHTETAKFAWVSPTGGPAGRSAEWPLERMTSEVVVSRVASMPAGRRGE